MRLLDGETVEVHGIGFAGVKGFAGGFGRGVLGPWGEEAVKRFVHEAVERSAQARIRAGAAAHADARSRCSTTRRSPKPSKASRARSIRISAAAGSKSRSRATR